jgi:hypothetical protein
MHPERRRTPLVWKIEALLFLLGCSLVLIAVVDWRRSGTSLLTPLAPRMGIRWRRFRSRRNHRSRRPSLTLARPASPARPRAKAPQVMAVLSADVLWENNVVLARRSQTRGDEVREATKNSTRFRITLPPDAMAVLRWHADRLPVGPMQESDLLFSSETGGFRSPTVLDKPFKDVCRHLSLGKKVTPKAMRRTFQDLARRAASTVSSSAASVATSPRR